MKIEHKLQPEAAANFAALLQEREQCRIEMLVLLGQVTEWRERIAGIDARLNGGLRLAIAAEKPPESTTPYALSADGKTLIGETEG